MKFLPPVWSGLWRKPLRTWLTFVSIVIAFILFGILTGLAADFAQAIAVTRKDVVGVYAALPDLNGPGMPLANRSEIERIPSVVRVLTWGVLDLTYQRPTEPVPGWAADPAELFLTYPEIQVSRDQVDAWARSPTGVIAASQLVRKYGWKIGDRIPFQSTVAKIDGSTDWTFDIVGIYDAPMWIGINQGIIANFAYVDSARAADKGTAFEFDVTVADPGRASQISKTIDAIFANSAVPSRTQSFSAMMAGAGRGFDIQFFAEAVVGSGFFMLLLLTANTMTEAVRERIPEFAVLKTLGFSAFGIFALILAEALIPAVLGALLGLALAHEAIPFAGARLMMFALMTVKMPWQMMLAGVGLSVIVAFVSGFTPALRVARLSIADALAGR